MEKRNNETECGLFLRGIVISSTARLITRKDGSGRSVVVTHEISTKPGLVKWVEFIDETDSRVKTKEDHVLDFPTLPELKPIHLKVNSHKADRGHVEIKSAQIVA